MGEFNVGDVWRGTINETVKVEITSIGSMIGFRYIAGRQTGKLGEASPRAMRSLFDCVSRASESQREGGFAVGSKWRIIGASFESRIPDELVGKVTTIRSGIDPDNEGRVSVEIDYPGDNWYIHPKDLEPADPAPALAEADRAITESIAGQNLSTTPQPAPMTRAARVLAGLERDVYADHERKERYDLTMRVTNEQKERNEAARLRMARMSLDRPLDAEQARWERLVTARVPVGRR